MENIINLNDYRKAPITKEEIEKEVQHNTENQEKKRESYFDEITSIISSIDPGADMDSLAKILAMEDPEQFKIWSNIYIESLEKAMNNPSDQLIMVQALNANNYTLEEFTAEYIQLIDSLDSIDFLPKMKIDFLKRMVGCTLNALNAAEGISKRVISMPIILDKDAKMPTYAHITDAGMDIYAAEDYEIDPGKSITVHTGVKIALPLGYEIQVRPKSGISKNSKLRISNTPGTIDSGYRGEICILIDNIEPPIKDITYNQDDNGEFHITSILTGARAHIEKGQKIAQLVLCQVGKCHLYEVQDFDETKTDRGENGFGSSGLK